MDWYNRYDLQDSLLSSLSFNSWRPLKGHSETRKLTDGGFVNYSCLTALLKHLCKNVSFFNGWNRTSKPRNQHNDNSVVFVNILMYVIRSNVLDTLVLHQGFKLFFLNQLFLIEKKLDFTHVFTDWPIKGSAGIFMRSSMCVRISKYRLKIQLYIDER